MSSNIPKSAFKKVCRQQSGVGGALKDNHVRDITECDYRTTNDLQRSIKQIVNKSNHNNENNNSTIDDKNDDLNYLISLKRHNTILETRVIKIE